MGRTQSNIRFASRSGSSGKTRLAFAVAKHVETLSERVQFVALASIKNPDLVGAAIVKVLKLQPVANRTIPALTSTLGHYACAKIER